MLRSESDTSESPILFYSIWIIIPFFRCGNWQLGTGMIRVTWAKRVRWRRRKCCGQFNAECLSSVIGKVGRASKSLVPPNSPNPSRIMAQCAKSRRKLLLVLFLLFPSARSLARAVIPSTSSFVLRPLSACLLLPFSLHHDLRRSLLRFSGIGLPFLPTFVVN